MNIDFSKTLVAKTVPWSDTTISLSSEFDKLQKELESLKQQTKYIEQRQKKRSWKKRGRRI